MSFRRMREDAIELCAFLDERLPGRKRLLLASSAGHEAQRAAVVGRLRAFR